MMTVVSGLHAWPDLVKITSEVKYSTYSACGVVVGAFDLIILPEVVNTIRDSFVH